MRILGVCALLVSSAFAAQAPRFVKPADAPNEASSVYVGQNNGTLPKTPVLSGKVFDRFIQIWLENTDFEVASTSPAFVDLAKQGILLTRYYALTHPSEPNYVASIGGDFFGMGDDDLYHIPANVSTVIDLLAAKHISWATYQENLPTDGFLGYDFFSENYLNSSAPPYRYYMRKHNPPVVFDSVTSNSSRRARIRNFNDFAADLNASAIPQWTFFTPNLVNDAHDTDIDFAGDWLQYWLLPLLQDPAFNDNRTLIVLTFDENENYDINNWIWTLLLGGAVPEHLRGTTDSTYYTHYSTLSTVENNWGLGSLGRGDTNKTMSNVFAFIANATGYKNLNVSDVEIPLTNATTTIPGPLNPNLYVPFAAPNTNASGAGGGPVFIGPGMNTSITPDTLPPPVDLTALNQTVPWSGYGVTFATNSTSPSPSGQPDAKGASSSDAERMVVSYCHIITVLGVALVSLVAM
ncbi:hypothetical protein K474DRAFT_1670815 [Panus rudis PR-1116 ss-1]|nr:hypothetical protein K474DRAFT_1670815 [Panus rudis PR-1116 ss-1]